MLSTTLWRAQKVLSGLGISIETRDGWLTLDASKLDVDVLEFKRLAGSSSLNPDSRMADLQRAVTLYRGELLDGVDGEWCEFERGHLRTVHLSLLKELVAGYRERTNYSMALDIARQIIVVDPMDEDTHRELMLLFYLQGNRSAALAQYEVVARILQAELGIRPDARTTDLWRHIRSRSEVAPGDRNLAGSLLWTNLGRVSANPMVGRSEELERITRGLTETLNGRGCVFVVSGEAGIGKTRLVEAAEVEAQLRGFGVLKGNCAAIRNPAPYQAFIQAIWPRISRNMRSETTQVLDDLLGHLSPTMQLGKKRIHPHEVETAVINEAFLDLLSDELPVLLVLEDVHHADQATMNLAHLLTNRLGGRKIMVLLSTRTPVPRRGFIAELSRSEIVTCIQLGQLTRSQTYDLIKLHLRSGSVASSILSSIWEKSGGNPFAIVEYVRFLTERRYVVSVDEAYWTWADSGVGSAQIPERVNSLLRDRIDALGLSIRKALVAAAILGQESDLQLLEKLCGLSPARFVEAVGQLFEYGLLVEVPGGFRFAHESYRLAALSRITGVKRKVMHRAASDLIEKLWPARVEDLAWHLEEAGDLTKAVHYAEASGDKARAVHANDNALRWYSKSLDLLGALVDDPLGRESRVRLLLKRQEILELLGHSGPQLTDLDGIIEYARLQGDLQLSARCQCLKARCLSRMNRNAEALQAASMSQALYGSLEDLTGMAEAREVSAIVFMNLRDAGRAKKSYEAALQLFQESANSQGVARAALGLGTLMLFTGESREGLALLDRAEASLARSADKRDYAQALLQKGVFCRCLGRVEKSETLLLQGLNLMRDRGDRVGEARGLSQLAYTHMTLGLLRKAVHEARRSIQLATKSGDTRGQIVFRNNAAYAVHRPLGDFGKAKRLVREALSFVRTSGRRENQAIYYDTMAAILHDEGEYVAAYHWARESRKLYRRWSGQFDYVGSEIEFHLGATALALGKTDEARTCLSQAVARWEASQDRGLLSRAIILLGLTALAERDMKKAVEYAHHSARLLRSCKGVEEIQLVYWGQATIYRAAGYPRLALRVLERAYAVIIERSALLKGRLRRTFLAVPANCRIMRECEALRLPHRGPTLPNKERQPMLRMRREPSVLERRERLLGLMQRRNMRQRTLAEVLGVSPRTIRSDIAALRSAGVIRRDSESIRFSPVKDDAAH
jgi:tetratricopeptide (TPR) repeat protein